MKMKTITAMTVWLVKKRRGRKERYRERNRKHAHVEACCLTEREMTWKLDFYLEIIQSSSGGFSGLSLKGIEPQY